MKTEEMQKEITAIKEQLSNIAELTFKHHDLLTAIVERLEDDVKFLGGHYDSKRT